MGDFNYSTDSQIISQFLLQNNLYNIHETLHTTYRANRPTYNRGTKTIDAMFATPGIHAVKGGSLEFQRFPSDHRAIWCDVSFQLIFGHIPPD